MVRVRLLGVAALVVLAGTAAADSRSYAGVTDRLQGVALGAVMVDEVVVGCPDSPSLGFSPGYVCFPADHITSGLSNSAIIDITDDLVSPVSAFYCQDNNADLICGGPGDFGERFCEAITLHRVPDTQAPNWDPASAVRIYIDGPTAGNILLSPCGASFPVNFGVMGHVSHEEA